MSIAGGCCDCDWDSSLVTSMTSGFVAGVETGFDGLKYGDAPAAAEDLELRKFNVPCAAVVGPEVR